MRTGKAFQQTGVEFYRRNGEVILLFPTHDSLSCLYVGLPHASSSQYQADVQSTYLAALGDIPTLANRVRSARQAEPFKGTNKLPNHQRQSFGHGWALVGDAAQHRDPITGMGIGDAFLGADLLAEAISRALRGEQSWEEALPQYQESFRSQTADVFEYTVRSAELPDLDSLTPLYGAIARDADATRQLMNVIAGNASLQDGIQQERYRANHREKCCLIGSPGASNPQLPQHPACGSARGVSAGLEKPPLRGASKAGYGTGRQRRFTWAGALRSLRSARLTLCRRFGPSPCPTH